VIQTTTVGSLPSGIAWDPGNEDVLVCNEGSNSVSIISAFSLSVRKTVTTGLSQPFAVAITQRQTTFGYARNVYFA
jgi:YVTN family beta-propeller protein